MSTERQQPASLLGEQRELLRLRHSRTSADSIDERDDNKAQTPWKGEEEEEQAIEIQEDSEIPPSPHRVASISINDDDNNSLPDDTSSNLERMNRLSPSPQQNVLYTPNTQNTNIAWK